MFGRLGRSISAARSILRSPSRRRCPTAPALLQQCASLRLWAEAGEPIGESAPLAPIDAYGASKAAADLMIEQMSKQGMRTIRLRPFNHTGPGQNDQFAAPAFAAQIARIERGEQEPVFMWERSAVVGISSMYAMWWTGMSEQCCALTTCRQAAALNFASGRANRDRRHSQYATGHVSPKDRNSPGSEPRSQQRRVFCRW